MSETAREQILAVLSEFLGYPSETFTVQDVLDAFDQRGTNLTESTIRTHVTSRMCADSPDNNRTTYDDFERVSRGTYRLRTRG
ncbi:MAG: hypothetical protein EA424_28475 [Planctomycetaceae bacterium]|nr:MAG: hypothetical protein EA424_28475 [Planctomycetaceae bacterium]